MKKLGLQIQSRPAECAKHGAFTSRNIIGNIWSSCSACIDEERALKAEEDRLKELAARNQEWARKIGDAGIPERFRDRTFDGYSAQSAEQVRALEFCRSYAKAFDGRTAPRGSALLIGKPGTGKTHLAASVALEAIGRGHSVLFYTVMRAIRRVKDTWSRGAAESESEAIEAFVYPDLLILDEVGVQFGSETERNILFDILNERYERCRPCILLSNLPTEKVKESLGERVYDRLKEDGGRMIPFSWDSYRGKSNG